MRSWQALSLHTPKEPGKEPLGKSLAIPPRIALQRQAREQGAAPLSGGGHSFSNMSVLPPTRSSSGSVRGGPPEVVERSLRGPGSPLPYLKQLQQSFGPYDISSLRLHEGAAARDATDALSAHAFAHGDHIVAPKPLSLRDAAHEATHSLQQRQPGLVPPRISTPSDPGERHAEAVADRVEKGRSAVDLLTQIAPLGMHAKVSMPPPAVLQRRTDSKTSARRIADAIATIDAFVLKPGKGTLKEPWKLAKASLQTWQHDDNKADEQARIGMAMHLGNSGSHANRELKRAMILLRTALLRHDSHKAHTEAAAAAATSLDAGLTALIVQAANPGDFTLKHFREKALNQEWNEANYAVSSVTQKLSAKHFALKTQHFGRVQQLSEEQQKQLAEIVETETADLRQERTAAEAKRDEKARPLNDFKTQREQKSRLIFVPSKRTDPSIDGNIKYLGFPVVKQDSGRTALSGLAAGGELFIVGHGNFGAGVGTHDDFADTSSLLRQLQAAGLPRSPSEPVELHIWACWGAIRTPKPYSLGSMRQPFGERLAQAMASQQYSNYNVVGYAGSVNKSEVFQQVIEEHDTEINKESVPPSQFNSIYAVRDRDYNRVYGEDWNISFTQPRKGRDVYLVRRRGRQ